jgi:serine/threonine protein kinase, bacterial
MSYCLNPDCPHPQNSAQAFICQACGSPLLLNNRYRVLSSLGQGGFGTTYLSKDESLPGHPNCVIKQLKPNTNDPSIIQMALELFEREAKTLGKIGDHPQIPRLLDYFSNDYGFYLVQEHISGSTLQQEIKRDGPITEIGAKQFLSELLPLIQFVHNQRVIHRDIKPSNIIRRQQDGKLVLIDFGAVKDQVSQTLQTDGSQTALTNFAIGTAGFAPPEQMAMRPVYASDIYALGVTCLYLLTGKSPKDLDYDPATGEMRWEKYIQTSQHFVQVLKKMLEVSVRHRYQTADEVLKALEIEPYLQSLANSMNTRPNQRQSAEPAPPAENLSPHARLARDVRARQNRDQTSLQSGLARGTGLAKGRSNVPSGETQVNRSRNSGDAFGSKVSPKPPTKFDADGILKAYARGFKDFSSQKLASLNLQDANLSEANFHEANLVNTNLQNAILTRANFGRACLHHTSFKNAQLVQAYFSHADLQGADLRGANLSEAYLSNANLRGANLCGANLTGAKISEEQLAIAKTNWSTIRPEGKRSLW